jgi:AraC-like DNA-binding protein
MGVHKEASGTDAMRVRAILGELALTGPLSVARVAGHLGTSPRSLQRCLARQKLTLRKLVDAARLDHARVLLRETDLPVQDVAGLVGYRTPGGFARAFARWTGRSPSAFRVGR